MMGMSDGANRSRSPGHSGSAHRNPSPKPVSRGGESELDRRMREECERIWYKYDDERSGFLDKRGFKYVFLEVNLELKIRWDKNAFEQVFRSVDRNGDGRLSQRELYEAIRGMLKAVARAD